MLNGNSIPDRTSRLLLRQMTGADAEVLWPMLSDARMWTHHPEARHETMVQTRGYVDRAVERWLRDGLSYWTVELIHTGAVIGSGGVQVHARGHWNLNYRIAVSHQGRGYATELATAALTAAHAVGPKHPCIGWIDEDNAASRRVATKVGLTNQGLRVGSADDVVRLAFADRPLDERAYPLAT